MDGKWQTTRELQHQEQLSLCDVMASTTANNKRDAATAGKNTGRW